MKNKRIRDQFLMLVVPMILSFYVILIISTNLVFYQDIIVKQQKAVWDETSIVASQLEKVFQNMASCSKVIGRDLNYDENKLLIMREQETILEEYQKAAAIRNVLYNNIIFFDEVETLAFIDQEKKLYVSDTRMENNWSREACDTLLAPLYRIGNVDVWIDAKRRDYLTTDKDEVVITLSKNIMNMANGSQMGQLFVNISEPALRKYYEELETAGSSFYFIVDKNGTIVSASEEEKLLTSIENPDVLQIISELPGQGQSQKELKLDGQEVVVTGDQL